MKLGCIADDFTGATDLANNLVRAGMRSVQTIGVPDGPQVNAHGNAALVRVRRLAGFGNLQQCHGGGNQVS